MLAADLSQVLFDTTLLDNGGESRTSDSYLAVFNTSQNPATLASALGASSVVPFELIPNAYDVTFSSAITFQDAGNKFALLNGFQQMQPNVAMQQELRLIPNDTFFSQQWYLNNTGQSGGTADEDINVTSVWDNFRGNGVSIAIVDDGLQLVHPDLAPNIIPGASFDFVGNDADPSPAVNFGGSHGTSVAGIAAGRGNNGQGISGTAPEAGLIGLRLVDQTGGSTPPAEGQALSRAGVDIFNNAWGPASTGTLRGINAQAASAIAAGAQTGRGGRGAVYVWAAGNGKQVGDNVNYDAYANSRFVIAVGSVDHNGRETFYSEPGAPLLVSAPASGTSSQIVTTDSIDTVVDLTTNPVTRSNEGYNIFGTADGDSINESYTSRFPGGTSASAAMVSGVVALMLDANPNLTYRDIKDILARTARINDPTDSDWQVNGAGLWVNHKFGFGVVDAEAAVNAALTHVPLSAEVSILSPFINVNQNVPDNSATGISIPINITGQMRLEQIELFFNAFHLRRGDLEVKLISPDGTESIMAEQRNSDNGFSYNGWVFTSTRHWGENPLGTWHVEVRDLRNGLTGSVNNIQLRLFGSELPLVVSVDPPSISEFNGTATGTVSRSQFASVASPVVVTLQSSDPTEATVPAQVIIPAGRRSATFTITAVDDTLLDGAQTVAISGTLGSYTTSDLLTVLDHETITVNIDRNTIRENDSNPDVNNVVPPAATVTVTRSNTDLLPPNHYVAVNNQLRQYDSAGVLQTTINVPWPAGARPVGQDVRDVVVMQNGKIAVYNGNTLGFLSVYSPGTASWQHFSAPGLSTSQTDNGTGGISTMGDYVFLTDMEDGAGSPFGIVRINTVTGEVQRFGTKSFGSRLFANGLFDSQLFELNPVDGSVIKKITVPISAAGSAGTAFDGTYLYFLHSSLDSVFKVDPDTGIVADTYVLNAGTTSFEGLAYMNGKLYILDPFLTSQILEYDLTTRQITKRMFVGAANGLDLSGGLAADPSSNTLYVSSTFGDDIYIISASSGLRLGQFDSGHSFQEGLAVVGDELFLSVFGDENMYVYSLDGVFKRTIAVPAVFGGFYSLGSDGLPGLVPTSLRYRDVSVGLDQIVYALDSIGTTVGVFDPNSLALQRFVTLEMPVRALAVDADGTIYGAADTGEVVVFNALGEVIRAVDSGLGVLNDIDLNITGKLIISNTIGTMAETTTNLASFATTSTFPDDAFVSFGEYFATSSSQAIVTLTNSDASEIRVPLQVIIPEGQQSITFDLFAVDDNFRDGAQLVFLSGVAPGYEAGPADSVLVQDFEGIAVDVVAPSVPENAGNGATMVRISRTDIEGPFEVVPQRYFVTTPLAIPDGSRILSPIVVPQQQTQITDVNVTLSLTHNRLADLDVFLVSPRGTRIELFTDLTSGGTQMTNTTFDDEGGTNIVLAAAPFTGRFVGEQFLSKTDGENPGGTWYLEITDDTVSANDQGQLLSWSMSIETIQSFSVTTPQTILDNDKITSAISVPSQVSRITDVDVSFSLHHSWLADLDVYLVSPRGTRVELFTDMVSNGSNMTNTVIDDEGPSTLLSGTAPFTGRFIGEELLSKLDGENPSGTWFLEITDDNSSDAGQLLSWSLTIQTEGLASATVTLASSDETEARVVHTVVIPANQSEVWVDLDAIDDDFLDGDQLVTISAVQVNVGGLELGSDDVIVTDIEDFTFSVDKTSVLESDPVAIRGTVKRLNSDLTSPVTVNLTSSRPGDLSVPASVVIPANQAEVSFDITIHDNAIADGNRVVTVTADAVGYNSPKSINIDVEDVEPGLKLTTSTTTVSEFSGTQGVPRLVQISVTRRDQADISQPMTVNLTSSNTTVLTVPASIVIPAGQESASVSVTVVDNNILEATRSASITATSAGMASDTLTLQVTDYETLSLTLNKMSFLENAGSGAAVATLTRSNTNVADPLVVTVTSSDLTAATVPQTVTIPAGQTSTSFAVTAVNDSVLDGNQTSTISVSALGYETGSVVVTVLDHEPPMITGPNAITDNPRPTITWTTITGATRYEIWVNNASTGQAQIIRKDNISAATPFYTPTENLGIGRYRVWVRAYDALEVPGFWSEAHVFTVNTAPAILTPDSASGQSASSLPVMSWTAVADARFYDLWVDNLTTGQAQQIRRMNLTTTSFTPPTALASGNYRFWVRAINTSGEAGKWSNERRFTVLSTPVMTAPTGGSFNRTPEFTWNAVTGATHYDLWVSSKTTGVRVLRDQHILGTSFRTPSDLPNGEYTAWVRAYSNTVFGDWSVARNFSIGTAPVITSPVANGSTSPTPNFVWSSISDAARFELWVDRIVSNVATRVIYETNLTTTSFTAASNLAAGNYRVWVRAVSGMGVTTAWSTPVSFSVTAGNLVSGLTTDADDDGGVFVASLSLPVSHQSAFADVLSETDVPLPAKGTADVAHRNNARIQGAAVHNVDGRQIPGAAQAAELLPSEHGMFDAVMADWSMAEWWSIKQDKNSQTKAAT